MSQVGRAVRRTWMVGLVAWGAAIAARGEGIDDFKLARVIPADVFLAAHSRSHAGQEWLNGQLARVWKALEDAHLERDLKKLFRSLAEESGEGETFDEKWQQVNDLLASVEWSGLCEQESAFAMKLEFPMPQFVLLLVPRAGTLEASFDGLSGILTALQGFAPNDLTSDRTGSGDGATHKLTFSRAPFPMGVTLARQRDVLLVGLGSGLPEQVLAALSGQGGEPLSASPRFKRAFAQLGGKADEVFYLDAALMLGQVRQILDQVATQFGAAQPDAEANETDRKLKALPGKVLDALGLLDYVASTGLTDGKKTTRRSVMALREEAKSCALYPALFGNPPVASPLKFVPKEAGEVVVNSGFDVAALYRAVREFVQENVPDGEMHVTKFDEEVQASLALDVEKDILGWIAGAITYFSVPGKTAYSPGDFVVMVSVRDEAKAREMLGRWLEQLGAALAQQNGSVSDAQVSGAEGFKTIVHPMLMMLPIGRPTIGVTQGQLILGSSPRVIEQSLATAGGSAPSFAENERFQKEGVRVPEKVSSLSFSDTSKFGEELGGALQMVAMLPMMMQQPGMNDPKVQTILGMITKLGPVVQKLDFLLSTASVSTFDGKQVVTEAVVNYQDPPKPKTPPPTEQPESETGGQAQPTTPR